MVGDWVLGAVAALTLLHGVTLLYAYRRGVSGGDGVGAVDADSYVTGNGVECPCCGEHNEDSYRYCRRCVSELPTAASLLGGASGPESGQTL